MKRIVLGLSLSTLAAAGVLAAGWLITSGAPEAHAADCTATIGADGEPSLEESEKAYQCILPKLQEAWRKSDHPIALAYLNGDYERLSTKAYRSATHGKRFVNNWTNDVGRDEYVKFEDGEAAPVGSIFVKESFSIKKTGKVGLGPLFIMEKMEAGFFPDGDDWKYTLITPKGKVKGKGVIGEKDGEPVQKGVQFCVNCHLAGIDHMMYMPDEVRKDSY